MKDRVKITVIASLNYDLVTFVDKFPKPGETVFGNHSESYLGGKGYNVSLALSRFVEFYNNKKISIRIIGNLGNDVFGKEFLNNLQNQKFDLSNINVIDKSTGSATITVSSKTGENSIIVVPGANDYLSFSESDLLNFFCNNNNETHFLIMQNECKNSLDSIFWISENREDIIIAYNPSPFDKKLFSLDLISKIDFLILNKTEARLISTLILSNQEFLFFEQKLNKKDVISAFCILAESLHKLINQKKICMIVITLGRLGTIYKSRKEKYPMFYKSIETDSVVDTTGAGDIFFASLITLLANSMSLYEGVKFATITSHLSIQKKGSSKSIPTIEEINIFCSNIKY